MVTWKLELTKVFKDNTLKNYRVPNITYPGQCPDSHGTTCYIWNDIRNEPSGKILDRGREFKPRSHSISNYIDLSDEACSVLRGHCITVGPGETAEHKTVRINSVKEGTVRVTANGWGHSMILFWEGPESEFCAYLEEYQKEQVNGHAGNNNPGTGASSNDSTVQGASAEA